MMDYINVRPKADE